MIFNVNKIKKITNNYIKNSIKKGDNVIGLGASTKEIYFYSTLD